VGRISAQVQELKDRISGYSQLSSLLVKELSFQDILNKYNARLTDVGYLSENIVNYKKLQDQLHDILVENKS
ncbi:hypothetical protein CGH51_25700, partial [Vibrio parahaemolyticus]|uniref:hypothetical protein n=1 Tax=Vibrio parahaemolyticus TaxID=670 RepID=UPI00116A119E